jgi:DNA-binding protein HU-beta
MATMSAAALKSRFAELLEIPKKDADDILWAFQEICTEAVKHGDTVTFPNVGKLSCRVQAARTARNPRTGEPVKVPAKVAVKFAVATHLKESAPSLKKKVGKALLAEAEEKQRLREKKKRQREREQAREESGNKKSKKKRGPGRPKGSGKKKKRAAARF